MDPVVFRCFNRFYLGLSTLPKSAICFTCGDHQDIRGIHDSRCPNFISAIHNSVRDSLFQVMKEAKFDVKKEVRNLLNNGSEERPADIIWENSSNGRTTCFDVSIVSYNSEDGIAKRESEKNRKYLANCQNQFLAFTPLVMNSLGKFSQKFMDLLNVISRELSDTSDMTIGQARYHVRSRIQFALISSIGKALSCKLKAC